MRTRRAFTLIEMLAAIAIIAILAGIVVVAAGNAITSAREAATRATILKAAERVKEIQSELQRVYESALKMLRVNGLNGNHPWLSKARQKRNWIRQYAPCSDLLALQIVMKEERIQRFYGSDYPISQQSITESAKRLYDAIGRDEDLFTASEVKVDTDGRKYLVDAWGQPLRFYLYPTRIVRPGGMGPWPVGPHPINEDLSEYVFGSLGQPEDRRPPPGSPDRPNEGRKDNPFEIDPDSPSGEFGILLNWANVVPGNPSGEFREAYWHTAFCYHAPLIVSPGADGVLGLYEPFESLQFGHVARPKLDMDGDGNNDWSALAPWVGPLNDNVTNFNSRR